MTQNGMGVQANPHSAANWYARAAASGWEGGQLNLAIMYMNGDGVPRDTSAAFSLLSRATRTGEPYAEAYLGMLYALGLGADQDMNEAERLFEASAKKHNPVALYDLGVLYSGRLGHAKDPSRAAQYLRQSLEEGYSPAAHALGLLLVNHRELDTRGDGVALLRQSAEEGNWRSAAALGVLYRDGKCVTADDAEAYLWMRKASLERPEEAREPLASSFALLDGRLAETQRTELNREAEAWVQAHPYRPTIRLKNAHGEERVIPAETLFGR
jgi:TPR repeat protein